MASKVEICNLALTQLGADRITNIDDDSENARKMNAVYDRILRSMLRKHPWNFASKESALATLSETPVNTEYTYVFQLPSDFVRLVKTDLEETDDYKILGKKIYSNEESLILKYIYFCEDPNQYDDLFIDAFAARLASELAFSISGDKQLAKMADDLYREKLREAKTIDSQEETPDELTANEWLDARE